MTQQIIPISSPQDLFPYDFLYDQSDILDSLSNNPKIMLQASTGYGKTILSLVSMLYHLFNPNPSIDKIIIFVRTKTQIFRFLDEISSLTSFLATKFPSVPPLLALPLIGKEELCVYPFSGSPKPNYINCKALQCSLFSQDYKNIQSQTISNLFLEFHFSNSKDISYRLAETFPSQCPYYIIRSLLKRSRIIVTTHAWLIQPKLFSALNNSIRPDPSRTGIIIDEAHNFKATVIDSLSDSTLKSAIDFCSTLHLSSLPFLQDLLKQFQSASFLSLHEPLIDQSDWHLDHLLFDANTCEINHKNQKSSFLLRKIHSFLLSDTQSWYVDAEPDPTNTNARFKTLNALIAFPSHFFSKIAHFSRIILMSGTFIPLQDYHKLYGLSDSFKLLETAPLAKNLNLLMFVDQFLTSKHSHRSTELFTVLTQLISDLHGLNPFHTLVFSPSKEFSTTLSQFVGQTYPNFSTFLESSSAENQTTISNLKTLDHALIFASFGGSFSEGIEIKDKKTKKSKISLIIFTGVPLPAPTQQQKVSEHLYMTHFDKIESNHFLYQLPIFQMSLQAAGRGIRQPNDNCALVILDYRFDSFNLFPKDSITYSNNWITIFSSLKSFFPA